MGYPEIQIQIQFLKAKSIKMIKNEGYKTRMSSNEDKLVELCSFIGFMAN